VLSLACPASIRPGSGSHSLPGLKQNNIIYTEMENEFIYSFGQSRGENFSICLYIAHSNFTTYREMKQQLRQRLK
jgi:hypothetical protein